jgi:hypothetical protein
MDRGGAGMTRAELCMAACECLSDDEVRELVASGGLRHLKDIHDTVGKIVTLTEAMRGIPKTIADMKGNLAKARPFLIAMLAEIEEL